MIPYDDLVAALTSWRSRQGLPTAQIASPGPAAAPKQAAPPAPAPAPAPARPTPAGRPAALVIDPTHEDSLDVDEASLLDESSFDSELGMAFDAAEIGESTSIGVAPSPRSAEVESDDVRPRPPPPRRGGR